MMLLEVTTDPEKVCSVLKHDDIWPNIADTDKESFEPPMDGVHYLHSEGILFILHGNEELQIHANVILEQRTKAVTAAQDALEYGFNNLNAKRIFCEIPTEYPNVYGFALKFLNDQGIEDGQHILDLRKDQWASCVR